jgi:hypothetical protein
MVNYFFSEEEIFTFDQIFDFGNTINERIQKFIDLKSSDQGPNKKRKYIDNNNNNIAHFMFGLKLMILNIKFL